MDKVKIYEASQNLIRVNDLIGIESWLKDLKNDIPFEFSIISEISSTHHTKPICVNFSASKLTACLRNNSLDGDPLFTSLLKNNHNMSVLMDPVSHPEYGNRLVISNRKNSSELFMFMLSFGDRSPSTDEINALYLLLPHLYLTSCNINRSQTSEVSITKRERELLQWLKSGKSNWEIGQLMNINERTVKFHLANIYKKFDVSNRTQAVARFISMN